MTKTLALVLALVLVSAGAVAQDYIFAFRGAYQDTIASQPCGANGLKGPASMTVYDRNAWLVYTCNDDRVVLRRYFNPNDNAVPTPAKPVTALSADELRAWELRGVDFGRIASGARVPDGSGRLFIHDGRGWTVQ